MKLPTEEELETLIKSGDTLSAIAARAKEADDLEKDLRSAERLLRIAKEDISRFGDKVRDLREANNNLHQGINRIGDEVRELRAAVTNEVAKSEAFKGEIVTAGNHAACRLNVLGDIHRILGSDGEPTGANALTGVSPELARLPKRIERLLQDTVTWRERYDKEVFKNGELVRLMENLARNVPPEPMTRVEQEMVKVDSNNSGGKVVDNSVTTATGSAHFDTAEHIGQAWCRTDEEYPKCLELVTWREAKPLRVVLCDIVRRTTKSGIRIEYVPIQVDDLPQVTEAAAS